MAFVEGALGSVAGDSIEKGGSKGKATTGKGLGAKWHGIPVWTLAIAGGLGVYLLYRYYENNKASSTASPLASTGSTSPSDTGTGGGLGGGGSGGGTPWWQNLGSGSTTSGETSTAGVTATTPSVSPSGPSVVAAPSPAPSIASITATPQGSASVSTPNPNTATVLATNQLVNQLAATPAGVSAGANPSGVGVNYGGGAASPADVAAAQALVANEAKDLGNVQAPAQFINSGTAANNAAGTAGKAPATASQNKAAANPTGVGVHY